MGTQFYSPVGAVSTFRCALAALVVAGGVAGAEPPKFSEGGFVFSVQYGPGFWSIDQEHLAAQAGADSAAIFVGDLKAGHTLSLKAAYVILGHASIGADFTATGWDLFDTSRGGAGFLTGTVGWHPLETVFKVLKYEKRPVAFDLSTAFGVGYGIGGQRRGSDGLVLEWTIQFDWFFARYFALGTFARGVFLKWNNLYIDFNNRDLPGATIPLPNGMAGSFWTVGLSLNFRAGD